MSALNLATREGLEDFLLSHVYGLSAVLDVARNFSLRHLSLVMPDYLALAQADLRALGRGLPPSLQGGHGLPSDGPGACYVILGSRLGMGVLRQRDCWRGDSFDRSAYMEDRSEKLVWAALLDWLAAQPEDRATRGAILAGVQRAFAGFEAGLARVMHEKREGSLAS